MNQTKCAHFKDEIEDKNRVTLIIEPQNCGYRTQHSTSFIFEKDPKTGKVDLDYCSQSLNENDRRKTFRNCTHFGMVSDEIEGAIIELTSEFSDSSFYLHCYFKQSYIGIIVNSINRLIETVLNGDIENQSLLIANNLNQESCASGSVFPLCHILDSDLTSVIRNSGGIPRYIKCVTTVSNYAESSFDMVPIMTAYAIE
jgi:hypothetical protein